MLFIALRAFQPHPATRMRRGEVQPDEMIGDGRRDVEAATIEAEHRGIMEELPCYACPRA